MCMKEHGLPPDPYSRSVDDPEMKPCAAALDAFQRCGREFLDGVETTQPVSYTHLTLPTIYSV